MRHFVQKALVLFLPLALGAATTVAGASPSLAANPCAAAAQDIQKSCQAGAIDDFWLASARCVNLSSREELAECNAQAFEDRKDAQDECADQYDARRQVCDRLGGGAYQPELDPAGFVEGITNPYFPLVPGTTLIYEHHTPDGLERDVTHVTHDVKEILGIPCTVVRDVVTLDGEVIEDTLDWYAQDIDGNVWYMGEEAKDYEEDELISIEGSWRAGRDGALPGIIMEAHPMVGDFYRQEYYPDEAEDVAGVRNLDRTVTVPYGTFDHCLMTDEFSPIEPGVIESKLYAEGIGTVLEIEADGTRLELIAITHD